MLWNFWRHSDEDAVRELVVQPLGVLDALVQKGNARSGHRGHLGRKGHKGGSLPRNAGLAPGAVVPPPDPEALAAVRAAGEMGELPLEPPPPDWLVNGEIEDVKNAKGGVNHGTSRGKIKGKKVVMHPGGEGLTSIHCREYVPIKVDNEREMAARIVNQALGGIVDMPAGAIRRTPYKMPGYDDIRHEVGFVQVFAPGKDFDQQYMFGGRQELRAKHKKDAYDIGFFDAVIGNLDRHQKNFIVKPNGVNLTAIDHGLAFPIKNGNMRANTMLSALRKFDTTAGKLTTGEVDRLKGMVARKGEVTKALGKYLEKPAIAAMWSRVDRMIRTSEIHYPGDDWADEGNREKTPASYLTPPKAPPMGKAQPSTPSAPKPDAAARAAARARFVAATPPKPATPLSQWAGGKTPSERAGALGPTDAAGWTINAQGHVVPRKGPAARAARDAARAAGQPAIPPKTPSGRDTNAPNSRQASLPGIDTGARQVLGLPPKKPAPSPISMSGPERAAARVAPKPPAGHFEAGVWVEPKPPSRFFPELKTKPPKAKGPPPERTSITPRSTPPPAERASITGAPYSERTSITPVSPPGLTTRLGPPNAFGIRTGRRIRVFPTIKPPKLPFSVFGGLARKIADSEFVTRLLFPNKGK